MGKQAFEHLLGFHGAPLLVGMKPAVLLSFRKDRFEDFDALLASYAPCFRCKGITVRRLAEGKVYVLLLFYRARALARFLKQPQARALLERCGYDGAAPLGARGRRRSRTRLVFSSAIRRAMWRGSSSIAGSGSR